MTVYTVAEIGLRLEMNAEEVRAAVEGINRAAARLGLGVPVVWHGDAVEFDDTLVDALRAINGPLDGPV